MAFPSALEDARAAAKRLPVGDLRLAMHGPLPPRIPRALVLRGEALFSRGDYEHALVFFYRFNLILRRLVLGFLVQRLILSLSRVKHLTSSRDRRANMGIQRWPKTEQKIQTKLFNACLHPKYSKNY